MVPDGQAGGPTRGQSGVTLIEAVLSLIVVSVAIISIAGGLLTSVRVDDKANRRQRANLALTTFVENMPYVSPPGSCATSPTAHATSLYNNTVTMTANGQAVPQPEVQQWLDRGAVFTVTDVEYSDWRVVTGEEQFTASCNDKPTSPDPNRPTPFYPVIRVTVEACLGSGPGASSCAAEEPVVATQAVKRGGRIG
jgi:Tfp pilus assembly protein PilV